MVYVRATYMSYMSYMSFMTYMTSVIWHAYILQYGCQKKRQNLRNAANLLRFTTKLFLWPKTDISCFPIFPLFFSEFSFYIFRVQGEHFPAIWEFEIISASYYTPQKWDKLVNYFISDLFWTLVSTTSKYIHLYLYCVFNIYYQKSHVFLYSFISFKWSMEEHPCLVNLHTNPVIPLDITQTSDKVIWSI